MTPAPAIALTYAQARLTGDTRAAIEAINGATPPEWLPLDRVAETIDVNPAITHPEEALRMAGYSMPVEPPPAILCPHCPRPQAARDLAGLALRMRSQGAAVYAREAARIVGELDSAIAIPEPPAPWTTTGAFQMARDLDASAMRRTLRPSWWQRVTAAVMP